MTREEAIRRVKKCLALSESSNENEAATALRHAQSIMRQYRLTDLCVATSSVTEHSCQSGVSSKPPLHLLMLARTVANAFACEVFVSRVLGRAEIVFIGIESNAELAGYAYTVLRRALERDRRDFVAFQPRCKRATKVRRGKLFCLAWVDAVSATVRGFAGSPEERKNIGDYMRSRYKNLTESKPDNIKFHPSDSDAAHAGDICGRNQQIRNGVNADSPDRRIGCD